MPLFMSNLVKYCRMYRAKKDKVVKFNKKVIRGEERKIDSWIIHK